MDLRFLAEKIRSEYELSSGQKSYRALLLKLCSGKIGENESKSIWIIGRAGTGKTHLLFHFLKSLEEKGLECDFFVPNLVTNNKKNAKILIVDGYEELSETEREVLKEEQKNKKVTIFTSRVSAEDCTDPIWYEQDEGAELVLKDVISTNGQRGFCRNLSFRQLHLVKENWSRVKDKESWEALQKVYENIITKANVGGWKAFKTNYLENCNFPMVRVEDNDMVNKLLDFGIIKKNKGEYTLENLEFLIPVVLRKHNDAIFKRDFTWVTEFINKIPENNKTLIASVIASYACERKSLNFLECVITSGFSIDTDYIMRFIWNRFGGKRNLSHLIWHLDFSKAPISILYATRFLTKEEAVVFFTKRLDFNYEKGVFFNEELVWKVIHAEKRVFITALIACYMQVFKKIDISQLILVSRVAATVSWYRRRSKNSEKGVFFSYSDDKQLCKAFVFFSATRELGVKIFKNVNEIKLLFSGISIFWRDDKKPDASSVAIYEKWISEKLMAISMRDEHNNKNPLKESFGLSDHMIQLDDVWVKLRDIDPTQKNDRLINSFFLKFFTWIAIAYEGIDGFRKLVESRAKVSDVKTFHGPGWYIKNREISQNPSIMISSVMLVALKGEIFQDFSESTPYLGEYEKPFDLEVDSKIKDVKKLLIEAGVIRGIEILEIINCLKIIRNGTTFYPIYIYLNFENGCYSNVFLSSPNIKTICEKKNGSLRDNWYWDGNLPGIPTTPRLDFSNAQDFIIHNDEKLNQRALYTSNCDLLNRNYEFFRHCYSKGKPTEHSNDQNCVINLSNGENWPSIENFAESASCNKDDVREDYLLYVGNNCKASNTRKN